MVWFGDYLNLSFTQDLRDLYGLLLAIKIFYNLVNQLEFKR